MKIKRILLSFILICFAVCIGMLNKVENLRIEEPNRADVNDLLMTMEEQGEDPMKSVRKWNVMVLSSIRWMEAML